MERADEVLALRRIDRRSCRRPSCRPGRAASSASARSARRAAGCWPRTPRDRRSRRRRARSRRRAARRRARSNSLDRRLQLGKALGRLARRAARSCRARRSPAACKARLECRQMPRPRRYCASVTIAHAPRAERRGDQAAGAARSGPARSGRRSPARPAPRGRGAAMARIESRPASAWSARRSLVIMLGRRPSASGRVARACGASLVRISPTMTSWATSRLSTVMSASA